MSQAGNVQNATFFLLNFLFEKTMIFHIIGNV
jgi:hypothetical protein